MKVRSRFSLSKNENPLDDTKNEPSFVLVILTISQRAFQMYRFGTETTSGRLSFELSLKKLKCDGNEDMAKEFVLGR